MLTSIYTDTITISSLGIIVLFAIILGLVIAISHKLTSKYSKNFLITLSLLPLLVSIIIIMVNGNLGTSVAVLGAFSLVRFRSVPGNSKEIASIFAAMAIGLALGMGQVIFAIGATIVIVLITVLLSKTKIFDESKQEKKLLITIPENIDYTDVFDDIFKKYKVDATLEKTKTTNMGSMFELTYVVKFNDNINEKAFIDDIRVRNGNLKVALTHKLDGGEL